MICVNKDVCAGPAFDLATALLFNNLDAQRGLHLFRRLATCGHSDGMVATGIVLVEGLGVRPQPKEGLKWLQKACEQESAQAYYEMGSAYYNGIEG